MARPGITRSSLKGRLSQQRGLEADRVSLFQRPGPVIWWLPRRSVTVSGPGLSRRHLAPTEARQLALSCGSSASHSAGSLRRRQHPDGGAVQPCCDVFERAA
ncbi:MAG: hypothetical protein K0Q84_3059, partial [Arthrobacter sp.]|nr:hypothetical protein [Arthrobacter sp.]